MFKKKKNTYICTDFINEGGKSHAANIHQVVLKVNQTVWDMMKILEKRNMYGFNIEAKIGTKKIVVVLKHTDIDLIQESKHILKEFYHDDEIMFLTKHVEKEKSNFIRNSYIFIFLLTIMSALVYMGYQWYKKQGFDTTFFSSMEQSKNLSDTVAPTIQKVEIDVKKLVALKEVFVEEEQYEDIKKVMTMTVDVISMSVSKEEKEKYSSEALVKSFKGKSGFEYVLKEDNNTEEFHKNIDKLKDYSDDFVRKNHTKLSAIVENVSKDVENEHNQSESKELVSLLKNSNSFEAFLVKDENNNSLDINFKELDGYAKAFVEQNENKMAERCYVKALRDFNLTKEERAFTFIQKALLSLDRNDTHTSKKNYDLALTLYQELSSKKFQEFSLRKGWTLEQLSQFATEEEERGSFLEEAEKIYLKRIEELRKNVKRGSIKDKRVLAKELYLLSNFYMKELHNLDKSILFNIESLNIYRNLKEDTPFEYLKSLFALANKYNSIEQFQKSEKLYIEAMKSSPKIDKERELYRAKIFHQMANFYSKIDKNREAENYYKQTLDTYAELIEKNYQKYKPMALLVERDIALYEQKNKAFDKSNKRFLSILADYKRLSLGNSTQYNIEIAKTWNLFAKMLLKRGEPFFIGKVEGYLNNALKLSEKILYEKYKEATQVQSQSYFYLALFFDLKGDFTKTESYYLKALQRQESFLITLNYAKFLAKNEKIIKAQKLYFLLLKKHYEEEKSAKLLVEYGKFYLNINSKKSITYLNDSLAIYEKLAKKYQREYKEIEEIKKLLASIK